MPIGFFLQTSRSASRAPRPSLDNVRAPARGTDQPCPRTPYGVAQAAILRTRTVRARSPDGAARRSLVEVTLPCRNHRRPIFAAIAASDPSRAGTLRRLDFIANLLDSAFVIPGTTYRVGLDAVIGIMPGLGDLITTGLSGYIIWEARRLGAPKHLLLRMLGNLAVDSTIGAVPLLGDAFDVVFKSNRRNMRLLHDWIAKSEGRLVEDVDYRVVEPGR
jgi:hypothetical protein